ncbi:hypothetical protein BO94DRAFT_553237 [Aspergillus sclerotioniger CBS 115572]|uniref:Amino acid transporter n=1 Tax=Aspergillus sclerotioniger CBS 115572 TaxID=1450535 RepID=A0A317XA99_9EURO|nr:hypothetical protein BO94DRAFT_553237 [Aspergillus sclerotioniger CBS 115572]PWY95325.1 hypothetical protein BO94DRAFT_553237 [Aspergillus sclerotioniger CBS 115572]
MSSEACPSSCLSGFRQGVFRLFFTDWGAYHYACFLVPDQYRRQVAYPLGWMKYLGCCAIVATLVLGLVNLCRPEFDVTSRWKLFLVYLAVNGLCWLCNLWGVKGIPTLELIGCYATALGFVAFTTTLLVKALKADPSFVFVDINNDTGYSSNSFAVLLGMFTSFSTLMGLDGPAHLAELHQPKKPLPRIMLIVIFSQFVVGVVWIIVLGFSITDLAAITKTATGVPILELIRRATGSNAAAIVFCLIVIINNTASALGSAVTMSRQGYAFARDGGLLWNSKLIEMSPGSHMPFWSINLPLFLVAAVGLIFGFPSLVLLVTRGRLLPENDRWNFGTWSIPIYGIAVGYSVLVVIVSFIPQSHPVTAVNVNYTVLVMGCFAIAMGLGWVFEGRKLFSPPVNDEVVVATSSTLDGLDVAEEEVIIDGITNGQDKYHSSAH